MNQQKYTLTCQYDKCRKQFQASAFWARYCCQSHRQLDYVQRKAGKEQQKQATKAK